MKKKYKYLVIILLIVASCAAFGRIANNDFIYFDDIGYLTENYHIQSGISFQNIRWAFTAVVLSNWHPLTLLSHMLDWSLFGANASGHHLVSLLLHIGAVIFLFLFLNKTTNNLWSSAFAAALFALHPLRVESVAWAAERKDVLSMLLGIAALYTYAFYAESSKTSRYFLCLILFALSLMAKPMLVTLPFVLLLLDYWPLGRWQKALSAPPEYRCKVAGKLLWEKGPFILLTIASSVITLWAQNKGGAVVPLASLPFVTRVSNAIVAYVAYLEKLFWPVDLAVFYPYVLPLPLANILSALLIIVVITAIVIYYIKKLPFLFVGWFWYMGTLIPVIGLVQVGIQSMADRYTYLPSIGIVVMLAWGIPSLIKSGQTRKKILFPAAVAVLIIMALITWQQCGYWRNTATTFYHALRVTKDNYRAHAILGLYLVNQGKISNAMDHYNEALRIKPNDFETHNYRGLIYNNLGQYERALEDYDTAIRLKKDYADAYNNRGATYNNLGQYQRAIGDYDQAIRLIADYADAHNNRGVAYAQLGQYQRAIDGFNMAIELKSDYSEAYGNRGRAYFLQGDNNLGCRDAQKACVMGNCKTLEKAKRNGQCH